MTEVGTYNEAFLAGIVEQVKEIHEAEDDGKWDLREFLSENLYRDVLMDIAWRRVSWDAAVKGARLALEGVENLDVAQPGWRE